MTQAEWLDIHDYSPIMQKQEGEAAAGATSAATITTGGRAFDDEESIADEEPNP